MRLTVFLFLLTSFTWAGEIKIIQAGKSFLPQMDDQKISKLKNSRGKYKKSAINDQKISELNIKVGDTINFVNKDTVVHNIFGKDINFNQKINSENKKTFTEKGTRYIRCAIHPKMKLKVNVD